ncbi:hypothetical protein H072_4182 [Dactylellina haptotyla CBS 200.50]|uniref:Uncharacterized protein n=1 Tax=Dactylellina haptotyla (strain CBS 200.50) TaxID=1284197 RepID=S8ALA8_DACHA|nr:hypothetical protein H072_4182 [Dactylellina haptotyla CBS 200.50]
MIIALSLLYSLNRAVAAPVDVLPDTIYVTTGDLPETVGWFGDPNGRGTFSLVSSCVITLTLCVWSALHLNVPPQGTLLKKAAYTRAKWVVFGLFAPELLVATASAQYLTARWLYKEIQKDAKHREHMLDMANPPPEPTWSMMQCFFATMGGIAVQTRASTFNEAPRITLSAEGVRMLSFLNMLPQTDDEEIRDKSKGDWLAKSLVCVQAFYIIVQAVSRLAAHMPISLLEVNTVGHVICALTLYLLWWNKPLELDHPQIMPYEQALEPIVALMYMCSPISESSGVSEIRCMAYKDPSRLQAVERKGSIYSPELPQYTNFSVGSRARVDPKAFIGVAPAKRGIARSDTRFDYRMEEKHCDVSPEHRVFMELQTPDTILQHAPKYCRWAQSDIDNSCQPRVTSFEIERWRLAGPAAHQLWEACREREDYVNYYFTTSSLGTFLGETYYLDEHIKNFAGLSYLGHVNVHRDHLKSILAFTAAAYGSLHIAAWKEHFPTKFERIAWLISSIFISCTGVLSFVLFLAKQKSPSFDRWINTMTTHSWEFYKRSHMAQTNAAYFWQVVTSIGGGIVLMAFGFARVYLVVEAFVSLRDVPRGVYDTPNWTNFFPHF